jgi:hypothetical protein
MSFWAFLLLLTILGVFVIAQMVKVLNSETKAGELSRAFVWSVIERIRHRKGAQIPPSDKESCNQ